MLVTSDSILDFLEAQITAKRPIAPSVYLDAAHKLVVLLGEEHNRLADYKLVVSKLLLQYLGDDVKGNVARAKVKVEATEEYDQLRRQEYKVKRIEEFVRVTKLRGKLANEEMKGY